MTETTTGTTSADQALKARHRAMWALGDYPAVATDLIADLGVTLVAAAGVGTGDRVLDVAAGSGNASVPAAQAGAHVVASDLTPELFTAGREFAAREGVTVEWEQGDAEAAHVPAAVIRSCAFVVLVVAVAIATFSAFAVVVNQVPLLIERGLSTTEAAWALGLGGLGQVFGRLGYGWLARALSVRARTVAVVGASAATTLLLRSLPGPTALLVAAAMLAGAARGVFTLLQATAISDRWGATHYGRLTGCSTRPP